MKDKVILITGGTGSLGQAIIQKLLKYDIKAIRVFSRNEEKQIELKHKFKDKRIKSFIGDIRDKDRLKRAVEGSNIVIHTAALKHVELIEYNPFEALKTNVIGTQNLIDCCLDLDIELAIAISSDKAVNPVSFYGATKLLMEKLFLTANNYKGERKTVFKVIRMGNIFNSSGSVLRKFLYDIKSSGQINVTNMKMTRFNITLDEAAELVLFTIITKSKTDLIIPKLRAYKLEDLVKALSTSLQSSFQIQIIGERPGEKIHEDLGSYSSQDAEKLTRTELMELINKHCF